MFGTYNRLGVHVYASNLAVIRAARTKLSRKAKRAHDIRTRNARKAFYKQMLAYHRDAQKLCAHFAL